MSVRQSLLAILAQGPCYGYQLRHEFDRRTGSTWPVNVGQIYNTLERLERDGLVSRGPHDEHGHVYWLITDAGREAVSDWFSSPVLRAEGTRDELTIKLAVAATLPGVDAADAIHTQREASRERLRLLRLAASRDGAGDGPESLARALIDDALIATVEAELRWLDRAEQRLLHSREHAAGLGLETERPKRGRPVKPVEPLAEPA